MSRPYKEVIIYDQRRIESGKFSVQNGIGINLKQSSLQVIWEGSINKFISDFELPTDAVISTKKADIDPGAQAIRDWDKTTINFKFNYQVWYKDGSTNYYVIGSNNTSDITCPNFLMFNGSKSDNNGIYFNGSTNRVYNPNIFPLHIGISSFTTSNKTNDFQMITGSGNDSECYLIFRYGTGGQDIQICLQTKDNGVFQVNNAPLQILYATLTFTGFNKIKRL